jgi:CDP-diacylglycerol--glycerol-3-phosphate 3-phosphatidyltransferase
VIDLGCSLALLLVLLAALVAYGIRLALRGEAHYARVDAAGASPLLGRRPMEMAYWSLQPLAKACMGVGLSANGVTLLSLFLAAGAGVALGFGHFGIAAALTVMASLGDALDGLVARLSGTASDSGEVFDAAVDRYSEFFFLGGLLVFYRESVPAMLLVLAAMIGSFMVSYATAKAEACQMEIPRGSMRRPERAVYLGAGATFVPLTAALLPQGAPAWLDTAPMLLALFIVALLANVSTVVRLRALAAALRKPAPVKAPAEAHDDQRELATTMP